MAVKNFKDCFKDCLQQKNVYLKYAALFYGAYQKLKIILRDKLCLIEQDIQPNKYVLG
jgi:hypothetical protein